MEIGDGHNIIAATTDNPTMMKAFRRKFQEKFYWTFPCFLHSLNTIIGEICAHPFMKQHVIKATQVVTFFNGSHYWGGQLKEQEDAQKKIGGLLPVAPDIVTIVLHDAEFWPAIEPGIKVMKPIVDLIRDEESHNSSLASCMLGLIRLAKTISQLPIEDGDNAVFNQHFFMMNTKTHSLALFLHLMCQKLAILQAINGCSFKFMVELTKMLVADLKDYHKSSGVFSGGQADALDCAECFIIHSIRYFLGLGGVQSVKCCNLSVQTFDYTNFLHKPAHRKHAHMHTWPEHRLDTALADELQRSFAWAPPLAGASRNSDDKFLAGTGEVPDIFKGDIIDWKELEKVDKGITPTGFVEEIDMVAHKSQGMEPGWNINVLLTSEGVVQ
ncbi:hypothetical protein BD769DRAFT_1626295 [Suillus cothurnatus]|nr:hypothetical protein BD769DRAFT_1626295 [Suillus cothurnatus]